MFIILTFGIFNILTFGIFNILTFGIFNILTFCIFNIITFGILILFDAALTLPTFAGARFLETQIQVDSLSGTMSQALP